VKLAILYFSGTGNTDYVARYLARRLEGQGLDAELRSIEQAPPDKCADFDALALGFPVFALDSPPFVAEYLDRLIPGEGRAAYVFCTKGAVAGNAVRRNLQRLAGRGYVPLGGASVGMPGSDGLAFVRKGSWMARAALEKDFDHLEVIDRLAQRMRTELAALGSGTPAAAFRQPLPRGNWGELIDPIWTVVYRAFAGYMRGKLRADDQCVACGLCARICPVGNIELAHGRPCFLDTCVLCMRCIHACPQQAIQIGQATVGKFRWHGPKGDFRPVTLRPEHNQGEENR